LCTPENPESIADAAVKFYTLPRSDREILGVNGKQFYERELSLSAGVEKFEELFQKIAQKR